MMTRQKLLWEFLLELLNDTQHKDIICWTNNYGEFRLLQREAVAKLWGACRQRYGMNYEKMARSIREYYQKGIIKKSPHQLFTYYFVDLTNLCQELDNRQQNFMSKTRPLKKTDFLMLDDTTSDSIQAYTITRQIHVQESQICLFSPLKLDDISHFLWEEFYAAEELKVTVALNVDSEGLVTTANTPFRFCNMLPQEQPFA